MAKKHTNKNGRKANGRVRRPDIDINTPWEKMSPLGRELVKISAEIEQSGEPLLSEEEIEQELMRRRSGFRL